MESLRAGQNAQQASLEYEKLLDALQQSHGAPELSKAQEAQPNLTSS